MGDSNVIHLEADRRKSGGLFLDTSSDLFFTMDEGANWDSLTLHGERPPALLPDFLPIPDPRPFAQMCCDPPRCSRTRVFRGPPCGGLEFSLENGEAGTFQQVFPFAGESSNLDNCVLGIAAEDNVGSDAGRLYITTSGPDYSASVEPAHLWRSKSGCNWCTTTEPTGCHVGDDPAGSNGWELANGSPGVNRLPDHQWPAAIAWTWRADSDPGAALPHVLDVIARNTSTSHMTRYHSTDGGATWLPFAQPMGDESGRSLLRVGNSLFLDGSVPSGMMSPTMGDTWSTFCVPATSAGACTNHVDIRAYFADPILGSVFFVTDGSNPPPPNQWNIAEFRWTGRSIPESGVGISSEGLRVWQAFSAARVPMHDGGTRLLVGSMDNGYGCTHDGGASWGGGFITRGGDIPAIVVSPSNPDRVYVWTQRDIARANNAADPSVSCDTDGLEWEAPELGADRLPLLHRHPGPWSVNRLAVHPTRPDVVARADYAVIISDTGAESWLPASRPGTSSEVFCVYFDDAANLYAGTDVGIFRCPAGTDGYCASDGWEPIGLNVSPPRYILSVRVAHPGPPYPDPTFWAATSEGLYRGVGTLETDWTRVMGEGGEVVSDVEAVPGPSHGHCVYAALGFIPRMAPHRGGVRFSPNNGLTWESLTHGYGIHNSPVSDIQVHSRSPYGPEDRTTIWAATYGRGVWRYDWGSALPPECR